jgi:hypothetical protein
VYDALDAGVVPVYLGAPDLAEVVPENSTLDAAVLAPESYEALLHNSGDKTKHLQRMAAVLAERILALDRDPDEYLLRTIIFV